MRVQEALHSLTSDPGLYQMLPHFSTFISEGVSQSLSLNLPVFVLLLPRLRKSHGIFTRKFPGHGKFGK